jgi:MFS transporter, DHA1 family, multidrug resistance protein
LLEIRLAQIPTIPDGTVEPTTQRVMAADRSQTRPRLALGLVVASTVLGLMGTDLVLPAAPSLPETLGGDAARAQLVLAAYVAGTGVGLLAYGALGGRHSTRTLFVGSLLATVVTSIACAMTDSIELLIAMRAVQGAAAAGPAVFAPGIIKALFDEIRAVRAMGALGSIEALAPAIAPIVGAWLLALGGWRLSFAVLAVLALLLAAAVASLNLLPQMARRDRGSYTALLRDPVFLRYALSQACVLGGLLTFVFGMPAVFVRAFGGGLEDFILMQICGVAAFMASANLTSRAVTRFGAENVISFGTGLAAAGSLAILIYALLGGRAPLVITALFVPVAIGLGLRGPPGFYRAVLAARDDDARGAALVILGILGAAAIGTAAAAPFVEHGLAPLATIALGFLALANLCLFVLPKWDARHQAQRSAD